MFRTYLCRGVGLACLRLAATPVQYKRFDEDRLNNPTERDPNSGIDRVLKIFDRDEIDGSISPEASFIAVFTFSGAYLGSMYGGIVQSKLAHVAHRESSEAVLYESKRLAHRELVDKTTLGFARGAVKWGVRFAIFSGSFAGLTTLISTFRGESGILEYSLGGLIAGAVYKFGLGPKGMISGGFFGTILGTFGGLSIYAATKLTGIPMQELYKRTQLYFKFQNHNFHASGRHVPDDEEPDIIRSCFHPYGVEMSNSLDHLEDIKDFSELKFNKNILPVAKSENKEKK